MGRTCRQRNRKIRSVFRISSEPTFVRLIQWMMREGWKRMSTLELAQFPDTGRGLMARRNVRKGDIIVSIPKCLLITTATVASSTVGHILASKQHSFLCQEVLTVFLVWEKHLGSASTWNFYLDTLPSVFTVPHCVSKSHLKSLPWFLQGKVDCILDSLKNSLTYVKSCFHQIRCNHCQMQMKDIFTWESFLWGWCCVNTRAVFLDPIYVPSNHFQIRDRNCLALAPYLDMFNHSDTAEVEVKFNTDNNCYEIKSLQSYKRFHEVYINYGPHSNAKLFLEYGFVLPSNIHDTVPLQFSLMKEALKSAGVIVKSELEKQRYFQKHDLIKHLYLSKSGPSWNCSTLIKILLSDSNEVKIWEHISFMGTDSSLPASPGFNDVMERIFDRAGADILKYQTFLLTKCNNKCCSAMNEGRLNPTIEMCRALLQKLSSVVEAGRSHLNDEN